MNLFTKITNFGISIFAGDEEEPTPKESSAVDQKKPKKFYIYAHTKKNGTPFYIGKGTSRRAWKNTGRHPLWHRYVENHLNGEYEVKIIRDNLESDEAEMLEGEWIAKESETLVNWVNFGRKTDFDELNRYHKLRNSNIELAAKAKLEEKNDLNKAIEMYYEAINNIKDYAYINSESGLVGQLIQEEKLEQGVSGNIDMLNRLTICLNKAKRKEEALDITHKYFNDFKKDANLKTAEAIKKRVGYFL